MKNLFLTLPLLLCLACLVPAPGPSDAGPPTDAAPSSDAPEPVQDATLEDAPEPVCVAPVECPPGYNWTPCGCATDNPDLLDFPGGGK